MENNQPEKQDILLIETLPVLSTPANIKNRHGIDIQQFRSAENNEQDAAVIEKAYSSQSNGSAFGHTEQSYNDIRDNYTEHALNDCNNTPQSGTQRQKEPEPNLARKQLMITRKISRPRKAAGNPMEIFHGTIETGPFITKPVQKVQPTGNMGAGFKT